MVLTYSHWALRNPTSPIWRFLGFPLETRIFVPPLSQKEKKHSKANILLLQLEEVGVSDPQVALILLRLCGAMCKLVHLARATPSALTYKAFVLSITSLLNPVILLEVGVSATAAAQATESRKHQANDPKCSDLGWVCVPMVVETYGAWGKEATAIISSVASRLATSMCRPKSILLNEIYGRLNVHLADVLVGNWDRGKPAAFDFTVSSPLSSAILSEASANTGAATRSAEECKHRANDVKCAELGWSCVPLAVETYGAWSDEAQCTFSRLASLLSVGSAWLKGKVLSDIYDHLNFKLMHATARALLARSPPILAQLDSG
eukprot:Em0002g970a